MLRIILTVTIMLLVPTFGISQNQLVFDPKANAMEDLSDAISQAYQQKKHVLVKVGYNQCPWCLKLNEFIHQDEDIDSLLRADYIMLKVNYSKENRNMDVMKKLDYPQRFGFPVLVILDYHGNRIHTQNTLYLEKGKSYDKSRILSFLKGWNPRAVSEDSYKE